MSIRIGTYLIWASIADGERKDMGGKMADKKPWLVDVPVKVNIWVRPECQRKQFDVIKQARPSILFIQSDGGRNEQEWKIINEHRKMFDTEIDWDCKVYKIYADRNYGLYTMGAMRDKILWAHVDRCISLEDDQIPSVSFFRFCAELLEKYKDDERICCICGMNHLGVSSDVASDYFFSRQGSIWGVALWKRTYDQFGKFMYGKDPYIMKLLKQRTKHNPIVWKRICAYAKSSEYEGHVAGDEFFIEFAMYGLNQLQIIPKYNMISNIGCSESAAHSNDIQMLPRGIRKIFNAKLYEMNFPLKHPEYVIPDVEYEKKRNRMMGYNYPVIFWARKVESFILMVRYGKFKQALKKVKNTIVPQRES